MLAEITAKKLWNPNETQYFIFYMIYNVQETDQKAAYVH